MEALSTRRGLREKEDEPATRADEDMAQHGPVLMQGNMRRQGDGWKGMKPWNERFLVLRASALICYPKDGVGAAEAVWKIDKVAQCVAHAALCSVSGFPIEFQRRV